MMRSLLMTLALTSIVGINVAQQSTKHDPTKLQGTWKVDLRSNPDAPAYFQKFEVKKVEGDSFMGTFYNSEIRDAHFNRDWDAVYFAFTTQDAGGGTYHTTGKLVGDRLEGTTHALGRKFLAVWRAEREK